MDADEFFEHLRSMREVKVRYGRATLTVTRWGQIALTPIGTALEGWRVGERSADDVAWAYVRERVTDHSPTFTWQGADLTKLVGLVAGVSREPEVKARNPAELAEELDPLERKEREQWEKSREQMRKFMQSLAPKFPPSLAKQFTNPFEEQIKRNQRMLEAMNPALPALDQLNARFAELSRSAFPRFGIDPAMNKAMSNLIKTPDFSKAFGIQSDQFRKAFQQQDWAAVNRRFIEAAREAEEDELADAVADTAEAEESAELEELKAAVQELTGRIGELEEQERKENDPTRRIFLGVAIYLIARAVVLLLASVGIDLEPPDDPPGKSGKPKK